ncbi:MAG: urea transporter [Planctomycetota bacterium]
MSAAATAAGGHARGEEFHQALLAGYGALFFAPHPIAGALFLLGTFAANSTIGAAVLVGLLSSTAMAQFLRRSRREIESGLYGFNGALVAFALFSLAGPLDRLFLLLVPMAALTAPIVSRLVDGAWCRRFGLPILSLPSLLVCLPLCYCLARWGGMAPHPSAIMPSYIVGGALLEPHFYTEGMRDAVSSVTGEWVVVLLFASGFLFYSWRLLMALCVGIAVGALSGFVFLGYFGAMNFMFVIVTAAPVYVALAATFTGGGLRSVVYACLGVVGSFLVWFHLGILLADLNLPFLTAPFFVTTALMLSLLRIVPAGAIGFLPRQIPLHQVGPPEKASKWAREQAFGWRYWKGIGGLETRPWSSVTSEERMARAREMVRRSRRIVVLTGAGVSTESGIPDYRSGAVAWKQYDTGHFLFDRFMASEESRKKYWEMSQDFYLVIRSAGPNQGHVAIGKLHELDKLHAVITQNVDGLHQRAGVPGDVVIEIHGSEHSVSCLKCGKRLDRDLVYRWILDGVEVPYCPVCQGILKPDSVAFGQPMREEESRRALQAVEECDLLVVAGTSLEVQPVATLPLVALRRGTPVIICNLRPTDYDCFAEHVLRGTCGAILPELFRAG